MFIKQIVPGPQRHTDPDASGAFKRSQPQDTRSEPTQDKEQFLLVLAVAFFYGFCVCTLLTICINDMLHEACRLFNTVIFAIPRQEGITFPGVLVLKNVIMYILVSLHGYKVTSEMRELCQITTCMSLNTEVYTT